MKSLIAFSHVLLDDVGKWCGVSAPRDHKTVSSRVEHEGLSFLTITLPAFCKDFEQALASGGISDDLFPGFARTGGLPRFLGGFLRLVFDPCTGVLLDDPSVDAIRAVRQFTMAFGKVEIDCSQERVDSAIAGYVQCEHDVQQADLGFPALKDGFSKTARILFSALFTEVDLAVFNGELLPKHGPGSTADRLFGNEKYRSMYWTERLDQHFPVLDYLLPNYRWRQVLDDVDVVEPGDELPAKVITVPKTLKTPRIIAIEPTCMQYAQQSLMEVLVQGIERDELLSPLIGFTDQVPNRELARIGSRDGSLATLDLSEASDRVSNQHVLALTQNHPHLAGAVQACRSTKADVPGFGIVSLAKFASMGSALCFPFEAMVFTTIIVQSIAEQLSTPVTAKLVKSLAGRVRVYGDDIIVPVDFAPGVIESLEAYGLKVNRRKSFSDGNFRESCGGDYFAGHWVTPVRVRDVFPQSRTHALEIVSAVSLRNQLFAIGCEGAVAWLDDLVVRLLPVYPEVPTDSPALGRHVHGPIQGNLRMSKTLHAPMFKGCVVSAAIPLDELDDYGALMKFFLKRSEEPLSKDSFRRAGRPRSVRITTRYVPLN